MASSSFPEEPLLESAPIAYRLAQAHCRVLAATGADCAWYHGFWQYLRLMDLAKTSGGQAAFLVDHLQTLARAGQSPRVLVSGSADYAMPAHAMAAYRSQSATLRLAVVDRCETPLALTRWYAERHGVTLATSCADILDHDTTEPLDVVFTNSFFGSFAPASRPRLVAAWRRLLRPGGTLLFTNRLRPGTGPEVLGFTPEQARAFAATAREEAKRQHDVLGLDPMDAERRARVYAENYRSHPVRSADELADLLKHGGFDVELLEVVTHQGRSPDAGLVSGPSTKERADYARVRAVRL
jgi:SAM-dependent methyltransferase